MKKFFYQSFTLLEAKDKQGKEWDVVLIQAGLSLNNKFYPAEVLKKAVGLFENAKAFAFEFAGKMYNHLPELARQALPEGCIKNLIGWYDNPRFGTFMDAEGKTQEGILARLHISENAKWLQELLRDAWDNGKKSLLGFSIDGDGRVAEVNKGGQKIYMVEDIARIDSVDIVTHPAAGGQLVRLLASISLEEAKQMEFLKKLFAAAKEIKESIIKDIDPENITPEQEFGIIKSLVESKCDLGAFAAPMVDRLIEMVSEGKIKEASVVLKSLHASMIKPAVPAPAPAPAKDTKTAEAQKLMDEMSAKKIEMDKIIEQSKKSTCAAMVTEALAASNLFEPVKEKVRKQFAGKIFEEAELTEAIKAETEVLAKLSESGNVRGLGGAKVQVEEMDKLQAHLDLLIDPAAEVPANLKESVGKKSAFQSIKAAYIAFNPSDPNVTFSRKRSSLRLMENITTGDFSFALGTSINKKMGKEFATIPFIFDPIVNKVPVNDFKLQEIIRWGGYSTLPTVAERGSYTDLMEPTDERATYTPGKKGGIVYVTRETIKNDDMRFIAKIPSKVSKAGLRTLQRAVSSLLTANGTYVPGGTAIFTAAYGNYTVQNLSYDHLIARRAAMKLRRERGTVRTSGTATSGTSTTICDTGNATILDNVYNTYYIRIVYGTGAGQTRLISGTATAGSTITVSTAWTTTPSTDSKYEVSMATNNDEKIGLLPKFLIYGDSLESKVNSLLNSEKNPVDAASNEESDTFKKYTPIYNPFLDGTSAYYWFLAAAKADCDIIEVGFVDGEDVPTLLLQDQATVGNVFSADEITYKVRYEYGLVVAGNEGLDGNFGTGV